MHSTKLGCKELLGRQPLRSEHPFPSSGCGGKRAPCLCSWGAAARLTRTRVHASFGSVHRGNDVIGVAHGGWSCCIVQDLGSCFAPLQAGKDHSITELKGLDAEPKSWGGQGARSPSGNLSLARVTISCGLCQGFGLHKAAALYVQQELRICSRGGAELAGKAHCCCERF